MTTRRERVRAAGLALLMVASVFATVNVGALGFVGTAEAAAGDASTFAVSQDGECFEVQSFGDGTTSVEDFYDYRASDTEPTGEFSSYGTTEFQQNDTTQMFLYNGTEGVSLVVIHDKLEGDDSGGKVTFNITGVPSGGEWAVADDEYSGGTNYDNFTISGDRSHVDWFWAVNRTDGGALRAPQGSDFSMTVDPEFNEDAHHDHPDGRYDGGTIDTWNVRTPDDTENGAATALDTSQPVTVGTGGCPSAPEADLNASPQDATVGETVTFDASNSTDDDGDIAEYRWDFDGDGTVDRTTQSATTEESYGSAGEYTATVTVVDSEGRTGTASATVSVGEPLNARADVPAGVEVNETFTADGSNSSGDIESYEWTFGDGTTATGASVDHAYGESGTYEVTLTVTDSAGNEDTDTATVEVVEGSEDAGPSAHLDASPTSASVGETVAFDASGSSDDDGIDSYEWDFDGDGTVDRTTESATTEKSYGSAGEYETTVTVVDTAGQTDTAKRTVTVEEDDDDGDDAPPTAAVTAPETVVVNDTFEIDASASTDDDGIVEYRWDFNDDGKVDRTTTEATTVKMYNRPKTFTTNVTVVDASGRTDSASVSIEVTEPDDDAPSADLHAPEKVHAGDEFDVNVTNVHDESGVAHVHWYFDGEKGPDGHRATVSFDESGTHTVTVLLRDEEGNERTMSTRVEVVATDEGDDSGGGDGSDGNDGGNTGGYTGGTDGGDSSDESSIETAVDVTDDDVIEIAVTDAESGDRATMTFPVENETENTTFDGMAATFDAAGDYDMTVESSADAPENVTAPTVEDDGFAPGAFLTVDHPNVSDEDLRSVSITFSVERSALNRTDAETDDVSLYRATNGSWERVDVRYVGQNGSAHEFRANLTELSTVAAGVDRPAMAVTDVTVDDTDVKAGDVIEVTATVANDGRAEGTVRADLTVDGSVVATENVSLPAGATTTVSFDHELSSAGTMTVGVNGETTDLSVASVRTDESGDAAESTTTTSDDSGGSDDSEDPDESNSLGQPGMGVGVALVALLCASLLALRRRN